MSTHGATARPRASRALMRRADSLSHLQFVRACFAAWDRGMDLWEYLYARAEELDNAPHRDVYLAQLRAARAPVVVIEAEEPGASDQPLPEQAFEPASGGAP